MNHLLPTFTFLGNAMEAIPDVAHRLVTHYGETMKERYSLMAHCCKEWVERKGERELCMHCHIKSCLYKWDLRRIQCLW